MHYFFNLSVLLPDPATTRQPPTGRAIVYKAIERCDQTAATVEL
jgi:hypothetical protein